MRRPPRYLAEILIATTWECNLRCSYCFVRQHDLSSGSRAMSPDLAVLLVDSLDRGLQHVETISLHLYGGEPFMNIPAIEAMVRRAAEKRPGRFRFAVTTNGTLSDPRIYELLDQGRFQIILSIDGPAAVHDACRKNVNGGPTHAEVLRFLDKVRSRTGCWVRGSAVVRTGWRLGDAVSYLRGLPVDAIKAQMVRVRAGNRYALDDAGRQLYLNDLEEIGRQVIEELESGRMPKDDRFSSRVLQLLKGSRRTAFCGSGDTTFGITPNGSVLPCILMDMGESRLGHIRGEPSLWLQRGRQWRDLHRPRTECRHCTALPLCGGGCQAMRPVCGDSECDIIRKNCDVAMSVYRHFQSRPQALLAMAGIV